MLCFDVSQLTYLGSKILHNITVSSLPTSNALSIRSCKTDTHLNLNPFSER